MESDEVYCSKCFGTNSGTSTCRWCGTPLEVKEAGSAAKAEEKGRGQAGSLATWLANNAPVPETKPDRPTVSLKAGKVPLRDTDRWVGKQVPVADEDVDPKDVVAWLCCDPFKPCPVLASQGSLTLGRDTDCDMILPHESVSKVHAMVRALGNKIVVEDRSTYGTFLNGNKIREASVSYGDLLTLGPYQIEVRQDRGGARRKRPKDDTRPFRVLASSEAMQGRLEKVALDEVLQQIEFFKKSGTLKVWQEDVTGILVVYEGSPMYAELDDGDGEVVRDRKAVFAMLRMQRGNFSFMSKIEAGEMTMDSTITAELVEFARQVDEGS